MKSTTWSQSNFPRHSFYKLEGKNEAFDRNISHSKMIIVTKDDSGTIDDETLIYIGSHNFSSHAWGREEKQGKQIAIANWELGIAYAPEKDSKDRKTKIIEGLNIKFPPTKYAYSDIPYFADVYYS